MLSKHTLKALIAASCLAMPLAHANLLDDISKASDKIKKVTDAIPSGNSTPAPQAGSTPQAPSRNTTAGEAYQLPLGLQAYTNAKLEMRVDNPFDRLTVPVTVPIDGPDGYLAPISVPVEGKVTMLQYQHRSDDSPMLIQRHYQDWLGSQGFELLRVCTMPCKALPSRYNWALVSDSSDRIHKWMLPNDPTVIAAYRADAMVLISIGNNSNAFSSFVKVVEGKVLDTAPWQKVTTQRGGAAPTKQAGNDKLPANPAPKPAADNIPDGAELALKLQSVKLLAAPKNDAKVLATLGSADGVVFMGAENAGFLQVTTAQGDGWVDRRLVKLP